MKHRSGRKKGVIEFELEDIFEDCALTLSGSKQLNLPFCDTLVENNIIEAMKRAKAKLAPGDHAIIPAGGTLDFNCEDGTCWWSLLFEVFDKTGRKMKYRGKAHVDMNCRSEKPGAPDEENYTWCTLLSISGAAEPYEE